MQYHLHEEGSLDHIRLIRDSITWMKRDHIRLIRDSITWMKRDHIRLIRDSITWMKRDHGIILGLLEAV